MSLDYDTFDQESDKGWRAFGDDSDLPRKCYLLASHLLERYDQAHPDLSKDEHQLIAFHAGQTYAMANCYRKAIEKFENTYNDDAEWNCYVGATIAFLKRDKASLLDERHKLAATAGKMNLNVVDDMVKYFNERYGDAYMGVDTKAKKKQKGKQSEQASEANKSDQPEQAPDGTNAK